MWEPEYTSASTTEHRAPSTEHQLAAKPRHAAQHLRHAPRLRRAAARVEGWFGVEDLADGADAAVAQVGTEAIEKTEGTVVQATVAPQILAELLKSPDEMGKALTDEATTSDP